LTREGGLSTTAIVIIVAGFLIGGGAGLYTARTVKMTAMPQLVSLFNAVGGGAAALVAIDDFIRLNSGAPVDTTIFVVLGALIGSVTFTGSLIAGGKLQGLIPGKPIYVPGGQLVTIALAVIAVLGTLALILGAYGTFTLDSTTTLALLGLVVLAGLIFGITMVLPIGGADMPVVISLLNSFTGTAAAMAGFVLGNPVLIISGALVGASGAILTKLMADAMNRSVMNIMVGGFGGGDDAAGAAAGAGGTVREIGADDVAIQLAYAQHVIIVPGYGLAVAQAQHAVRELAELLEARGVDVKYAIHPVAGRMPGHMNVLLAEANVPYPQLKEMEEINPEFDRADVALVIGANDVTNPAARRPGSPVSGMPILDVDHAKSIVVIKRSMGKGYAGIDNELYSDPKTGMLFADAKDGLAALTAAVKAL
ncbi:MAG: NAD(P)(+) transhydrogenase (Re/Si-specific) subunit beta, partial [Chloroflexota bacterium]